VNNIIYIPQINPKPHSKKTHRLTSVASMRSEMPRVASNKTAMASSSSKGKGKATKSGGKASKKVAEKLMPLYARTLPFRCGPLSVPLSQLKAHPEPIRGIHGDSVIKIKNNLRDKGESFALLCKLCMFLCIETIGSNVL
jgi:hypothetical protein